jgi:CheY-like chemotaxis protein
MNAPRVLLVEDNAIAIKVSMHMLKQHGFSVDVEKFGSGALNKVKEEMYSLILLDLGLPDMDGYEIASKIREIPAYANVHIIALTAHSPQDVKIQEACTAAGIDEVWGKPLSSLSCLMLKNLAADVALAR